MPYYNYICIHCGFEFEKWNKVDDREEPCEDVCPACGSKSVEIKISATPNVWNCEKSTL